MTTADANTLETKELATITQTRAEDSSDAVEPQQLDQENAPENGEELDLVFKYLPKNSLKRGDIIDGIVLNLNDEGILVDVKQKSEGFVPIRETRMLTEEEGEDALPNIGDEVLLYVSRVEGEHGYPILSIDRARGEHGWRDLEKAYDADETVKGRITGANRGGATIQVNGVQGFIPLSQLIGPARDLFVPNGEAPKPGFIGMIVECKILELNRRRNRAIFSERSALEAINQMRKMKLVQELEEGDIRRGRVAGISSFGAFVDLGGADGLVHISEMSWSSVNRPDEIVSAGQDIDVLILKVDRGSLKIALSIKRLIPEPWETIENEISVGQIVEGKVTKLAHFGAFARIGEGIEGLIHISELTNRHVKNPNEVVHEGDLVKLKVIRIEPERRRLGLSLKQAQDAANTTKQDERSETTSDTITDGEFEELFNED